MIDAGHFLYPGQTSASFQLTLSDGMRFCLRGGDASAAAVVGFWARVAGLPPMAPMQDGPSPCRVLALTDAHSIFSGARPSMPAPPADADCICRLEPVGAPRRPRKASPDGRRKIGRTEPTTLDEREWSWQQLSRLSACIGREVQRRGGVLLHSGLGEYAPHAGSPYAGDGRETGREAKRAGDGFGFLLAGRSGVGKSTVCRRLPPPWRALADDMTLVARDAAGAFWAHPFPTWSRLFGKDAEGGPDAWDVQYAVPLRAIYVLEQGREDRVEPLGQGHALSMLAVSARQASNHYTLGLPLEQLTLFHQECFDNLRALVASVPAFQLHVSLEGSFWHKIVPHEESKE